jgi:UDP-perosamine 4-acetyltransferase
MDDIVVIGGGGHGKVVIGILRKQGKFQILGYTDHKNKGRVLNAEYLGGDDSLASLIGRRSGMCAALGVGQVGLGKKREAAFADINKLGLSFPSIVSPSAVVNEEVVLEAAVVVMDGAVVNCGAAVGVGAIINTNCTVEHDAVISNWVHIASGATISGGVTVGQCSMIGAGAVIIEGRSIAADCVVGAGAIVVDDLVESGTYVGCPARRIR